MRTLVVMFLVSALAACGRSGGDEPGATSPLLTSPHGEARPIDVGRAATDPDELVRAATASYKDGAARLGAHRTRDTSQVRVLEQDNEVEALDETEEIDFAADGSWRAHYANSKEYGRDAFQAGGTLWLRPLYGKYHRRAANSPDEPLEILDQIAGTFGAYLDLAANGLAVSDGGTVVLAGRPGRLVQVKAGPRRKREVVRQPRQAWRDEATVRALEGQLVLDEATGVLLRGRLSGEIAFVREGRSFTLKLQATHAITEVGGAVTVTPPGDEDSVATPGRSTEFEDRQDLLSGIAAPARKAPTPSTPQPSGEGTP